MKLKRVRFWGGSFLVEALIAIGILVAIASSVIVSLTGQLGATKSSRETVNATSMAQEGLEAARAIRDADWNALAAGSYGVVFENGTWRFSGASDTNSGFSRSVTVSDIDEHNRRIESTVSWRPSPARTRSLTLSTVLSDWRNAESVDLGGDLEGDWGSPVIIGGSLDFGANFRGLAVDVVSSTLGLVGFGTVSQTNELCMVNVSDPFNPFKRGCINTGTGANELSIDLVRNYVFLAYAGTTNHLQIVDISNLDALTLKKQFTIAGNTQKGRSLDRIGNLIYFGTEGPATREFYVIDVSNVLSPVIRGSVSIGNDVNDVMAVGNYAYLASDVDNKEAVIVNISNPASPSIVKLIDLPGSSNAENVFYDEATDRLYVSRQSDPAPNTPEVVILDVSNKSTPVQVGSLEVPVDVDSVMAIGNMMFVLSRGDMEFRAYLVDDPSDIRYYGGIDFGVDDTPNDVIYENNIFYVAIFNRYGLRIITAL